MYEYIHAFYRARTVFTWKEYTECALAPLMTTSDVRRFVNETNRLSRIFSLNQIHCFIELNI